MKKNFNFKLETKKFIKYVGVSVITIGGSYLLSVEFLEFKPNCPPKTAGGQLANWSFRANPNCPPKVPGGQLANWSFRATS